MKDMERTVTNTLIDDLRVQLAEAENEKQRLLAELERTKEILDAWERPGSVDPVGWVK